MLGDFPASVAFSPDGAKIVSKDFFGSTLVFDVKSGERMEEGASTATASGAEQPSVKGGRLEARSAGGVGFTFDGTPIGLIVAANAEGTWHAAAFGFDSIVVTLAHRS